MEILCCIIGSSASIPVYSDSVLSPFAVCVNNEKNRKKRRRGRASWRRARKREGESGERSDFSNTYNRTGHGLMVATQQIQMPNLAPNRIKITKHFLFVC